MLNKFKLFISPYKKRHVNETQEGALLAFDFGKNLIGYSDFFPAPFLGEPSLQQQLKDIQKGFFKKRFLQAFQNAFLDAKAREKKQNLFFGLKIPSSHFLIEDLLNFNRAQFIEEKKFQIVKIKLKTFKIKKQAERLRALHLDLKNVKWRLDLNGADWNLWKNKLDFLKKDIDFVEDPFYDSSLLKTQTLFSEDWISPSPWSIKIVKPARESVFDLFKHSSFNRWKRIVFTHSLDHPLGQVISAYWAGRFYKIHPRFFETGAYINFNLQEKTPYKINSQSPHFIPPSGFGFGFGSILEKEKWKRWI